MKKHITDIRNPAIRRTVISVAIIPLAITYVVIEVIEAVSRTYRKTRGIFKYTWRGTHSEIICLIVVGKPTTMKGWW